MKLTKSLFFSCLCLLFASNVFAQTTEFPEDTKQFIVELGKYINASNKTIKEVFDKFSEDLEAGKYTPEQFAEIRIVSNMMLKRKMRSNPYFKSYLEALNTMENKGLLGKQFDEC
jgi:hypothetical protein